MADRLLHVAPEPALLVTGAHAASISTSVDDGWGPSGPSATSARLLDGLPRADVARDGELMRCIGGTGLVNSGIGLVDAQLVASALLTADAVLWARERRLTAVAERIGIAHPGA